MSAMCACPFRDAPLGIDVRRVVESGLAHKDPGVGQVGAGLLRDLTKNHRRKVEAYLQDNEDALPKTHFSGDTHETH